jgi:hypothetical protein
MRAVRRAAGRIVLSTALLSMAVLPRRAVAAFARLFLRRSVRKGENLLSRMGGARRIAWEMSAPYTTVALEVEGKPVELRLVALAVWFRSSFYRRAMTRNELLLLSRRFSEEVRLKVRLPTGMSLPVGFSAGVLVDATGSVLEWLLGRIW